MLAQLEAQLQIGRVPLRSLPRFVDQARCALLLRLGQRRRALCIPVRLGAMLRQELLVLRDLPIRPPRRQIRHLPR
jgi:hypothetical protein